MRVGRRRGITRGKLCFVMLVVGLILLLTGRGARAAGLAADTVIYNGKILTADSPDPNNFTTVQAAAIYDGKFIAVGSNQEVLEYAGLSTQKIDLGGRTVIPGLVETHDHLYNYGAHFVPPGVKQVHQGDPPVVWTNKAEFLTQIQTLAMQKKPGEWISTTPRGGTQGRVHELQTGEVTRFDLDKVVPNNPLVITWTPTTEALVNTIALNLLLERYPNIPGLMRDANGVPNGRLISSLPVSTLEEELLPHASTADLAPYYKMEMEEVAAQGITTFSSRLAPNHLAVYASLHQRGEMPMRLAYSTEAVHRNVNSESMMSRLVGLQGGTGKHIWGAGDDKLWLIGMSMGNIDHLINAGGSCVSEVYPREALDFPLWKRQYYGPHGRCTLIDPNYRDRETFTQMAKYGFRSTAMHSGGDLGIDQYLDLVEELSKQYPDIVERRWAIDHCPFITESHAERARKLGIMFSCGKPEGIRPPAVAVIRTGLAFPAKRIQTAMAVSKPMTAALTHSTRKPVVFRIRVPPLFSFRLVS